jgi:outer membrane protein assembly factor BamB
MHWTKVQNIFVFSVISVLGIFIFQASAVGQVYWERTYGLEYKTSGDVMDVQQTTEGGYIFVGETFAFARGRDVYLLKTDASGKEIWSKAFGGTEHDNGKSVRQTTEGGYIIAGSTNSFGVGEFDVYLLKTDADGQEEWSKTFGGSSWDEGNSVEQTSDGGYIVAGSKDSDVYLLKTDTNGNELWSKTFGGIEDDSGNSVQQTSDGGYIIVGSTKSFGAGGSDVYVLKTDADGDELWSSTFGGMYGDSGNSVQQTADGGYIVIGGVEDDFDELGGLETRAHLIKTDSSGNELWSETFEETGEPGGDSVQQTVDGGYIISGRVTPIEAIGVVYLIKTNSEGNQLWRKTFDRPPTHTGGIYGGMGRDRFSVRQTADGGYILAGFAGIIKTDADGTELWRKYLVRDWTGYAVQETSDGGYIIFGRGLIKTDSDGNEIWRKAFYGYGYVCGSYYWGQQTTDGGYINLLTECGCEDKWGCTADLIKTDPHGNIVFRESYGDSIGGSVQQTKDGGYIITGRYKVYWNGGGALLIKTDALGKELWARVFNEETDTGGNFVRQTTDGGYVVAGSKDSDVYLLKTDTNGNELWSKTFGGIEDDSGNSVQQTSDGGYIIVGSTKSFGAGGSDVYVLKTDTNGNELWSKTFGGIEDDSGNSVQQTSDGGYIIVGSTKSFGAGGSDVYVLKTDADGTMMWGQTFGRSDDDLGFSVQQTKNGGYIIAGEKRSSGGESLEAYLIYYSPEEVLDSDGDGGGGG